MRIKREEFERLLKELRWSKLFGSLSLVFVFFCLTNWRAFNGQGVDFGLRTSVREFLEWLVYGLVMIPSVGIAWWQLNKIDVREIGFKIGSLSRGHTRAGKVIE